MRYGFTAQFWFTKADADQLEIECRRVMDELVRLEAVDLALDATLGPLPPQKVEISYVVEGSSWQAAENEGALLLATALQAVRGAGGRPLLDHRKPYRIVLDVPDGDASFEDLKDLDDLDI